MNYNIYQDYQLRQFLICLQLILNLGLVSGASFSSMAAIFEPGARHTFDEAVGKFDKVPL